MKHLTTIFFLSFLTMGSIAKANSMALGDDFTCAWDGRSSYHPTCWGSNDQGQTDIASPIRNPFSMGAGAVHGCALYYDLNNSASRRVACWGDKNDRYQINDIPKEIKNPIALSVGRYHNCVIDQPETGKTIAYCWGRNDHGQAPNYPAGLTNPTAIYASSQHNVNFSCALHLGGTKVRCWGEINLEVDADSFSTVFSGLPLLCDDRGTTGVDCWSNRSDSVPPNSLFVSQNRTCRLDNHGIHCVDGAGQPEILPFNPRHPREIGLSRTHACSLDDGGIRCWGCMLGKTACDINKDLNFGPTLESIAQAGTFIETLSEFVYDFDANFLRGVRQMMAMNDNETSAFIMLSMRPFFADFGYRSLKREYLERAVFRLDKIGAELAGSTTAIDKKRQSSLMIQLLQLSLQTASPLLTIKEKAQVNRIVSDLGSCQFEGVIPRRTLDNLQSFFRSIAGNSYLTGRLMLGESLVALVAGR